MKASPATRDILETLRNYRPQLERLGVKSIGLFGSFATGMQTSRSDLDFVVEFSQPTYDNFTKLEHFLETLFRRPVGIVTSAGVDSIRVAGVADEIRRTLVHV